MFNPLLSLAMIGCTAFAACGGNLQPVERLDDDMDGIGDHVDACPDEPETGNGYQDEDGCPDTAPSLPATLNGQWAGRASLSVNGGPAFTQTDVFSLRVTSDTTAILSGICPDGSGSVTVRVTSAGIEWNGIYACPPSAWGGCPHASLLYFGIALAVEADGSLTRRTGGAAYFSDLDDTTASACDVSGEFTSTTRASAI